MKLSAVKISGNFTVPERRVSAIILIIYAVGIAGMVLPISADVFINLIPFFLILNLVISLSFQNEYSFKTITVFTIIIILSWIIEAAGVATGSVFGKYSYGPALGLQIFNTPVIIGLNWFLLVYGSAGLTEIISVRPVIKILLASGLMVLYDFALEATAPVLDMWQFSPGPPPARNYITWFLMAMLFHSLIRISGIRVSNRVAALIFVMQYIFFLTLAAIFQFLR